MKREAEQELLKTLNGQLKDLPAVAKTMIQQYQMSAIVLSILCGVLFVAALIGTIWLSVFFFKKHRDHHDSYDFVSAMTATLGGTVSVFLLTALCLNITHACAPIASIIKDFLN
ncbi:hypothetical protein H5S09_02760 [Limosilactobacillus sp. STM2_1]|uniref:Uncharacterized protein n=1 Tax=Limosilactobacillus rudii TaxID=2759755 RepID=A0A7W3YMU4_9LACO|nr:hypothetical protein [Limosilactobacillus rudii]MBB1080225.1 hypothetical protein [Limosilactobacillus rudii]MBB1096871.1 hypothetical protein [Limosilactobacillus rudii]MCD7133769.1 hypothetical protein [Limosilactobacillus rudii]